MRPALQTLEETTDSFLSVAINASQAFTAALGPNPTLSDFSGQTTQLFQRCAAQWNTSQNVSWQALSGIVTSVREMGELITGAVIILDGDHVSWRHWADVRGDKWRERQTKVVQEANAFFLLDKEVKGLSSIASQAVLSQKLARLQRGAEAAAHRIDLYGGTLIDDFSELREKILLQADDIRSRLSASSSYDSRAVDPDGSLFKIATQAAWKLHLAFAEITEAVLHAISLTNIAPASTDVYM